MVLCGDVTEPEALTTRVSSVEAPSLEVHVTIIYNPTFRLEGVTNKQARRVATLCLTKGLPGIWLRRVRKFSGRHINIERYCCDREGGFHDANHMKHRTRRCVDRQRTSL